MKKYSIISIKFWLYWLSIMENETGHFSDDLAVSESQPKLKQPSMYRVLLLNDDYTPMEFVVHVLQSFFFMDMEQATAVMLQVHTKGVGICGTFSYEIAETKVSLVNGFARENEHPLQCAMEKS